MEYLYICGLRSVRSASGRPCYFAENRAKQGKIAGPGSSPPSSEAPEGAGREAPGGAHGLGFSARRALDGSPGNGAQALPIAEASPPRGLDPAFANPAGARWMRVRMTQNGISAC